jgi:hypothetical protein
MAQTQLGDLSKSKFFDMLKPLLSSRANGRLLLKGKEEAELYLSDGMIVHARTSHSLGQNAFFMIMSWETGKIFYDSEVRPPERTIDIPTEQLFLNWSYKKHHFEKIREVIPSKDFVFRLSLLKGTGDKSVSADHWNVLALCNGGRTVSEMINLLKWDEFKTLDVIYQLVQSGLIEKTEVQKPLNRKLIGKDFFRKLESELRNVLGPISPLVIQKKLTEAGETEDSFPSDLTLSFIKAVGEEIPDEQAREQFRKEAVKLFSAGKQ